MSEYIALPLENGEQYGVTYLDGQHYERMFPNINVAQEFCAMQVWLESNPGRRKTKRGIKRFIANWLIRATRDSQPSTELRMAAAVGRNNYA